MKRGLMAGLGGLALLAATGSASAQAPLGLSETEVVAPALPPILPARDRAATVNRILAERLDTVLPAIMRAEGIDLWLLMAREYFEDPVTASMLDAENMHARRRTILILHDPGEGKPIERLTVSRHPIAALEKVDAAMRAGRLTDGGDFVAALAQAISTQLDPRVADLGDRLDECEEMLDSGDIYDMRRRIARLRSEAIALRRFVAPDRDALGAMAQLPFAWISKDDRLHLREAADRFARMAEELEAVRERAALLHEQLTDLRAEMVDRRSLAIAIVAFIFLPLTFITGLLGMNVEGIPFADRSWAFWGIAGFCVLVGAGVLAFFAVRQWLKE